MEKSIYKFILKRGLREQIILVLVTLCSFPFLYLFLQLPKEIINKAIGGAHFPMEIWGHTLFQFDYLVILCVLFLLLVIINNTFKYYINNMQGRVGERLLAEFRIALYKNVLRFPLPVFRKVSAGELVTQIASEVQSFGGFIGEAIAIPVQHIGTLLTIFIFMFIQDPLLGLAAVALYPLQMYFIPKLQREVNELSRMRAKQLRTVSKIVGETAAGIVEIHTHNNSPRFLSLFTKEVHEIYNIRFDLFEKKFLIKFINNFIGQLTPFFFYFVGGYYVIQGELTLGALVAILAAYEKLATPWKALLGFYQRYQDTHIKYTQVIERFNPQGLLPESYLDPKDVFKPTGDGVVVSNLVYESPILGKVLDQVSFNVAKGERVAVVGHQAAGHEELGPILVGLIPPTRGHVYLAGHSISSLPESVLGQFVGYVGEHSYLFSDSIYENLVMAFPERPEFETALTLPEGGNKRLLDYVYHTLDLVELREDIFQFGLGSVLERGQNPKLEVSVLQARHLLQRELKKRNLLKLIDTFDPDQYLRNLPVAENILFGVAQCEELSKENLGSNPYIHWVLEKADLKTTFIHLGLKVAAILTEKLLPLDPHDPLFEQFDFVDHDELVELKTLLGYADQHDYSRITTGDEVKLISLVMRLRPTLKLDFIDAHLQKRLLLARHMFRESLPKSYGEKVAFFHPDQYNQAASLRDNILFGRPARTNLKDNEQINLLVRDVVRELALEQEILNLGLQFNVGIAGARLSKIQQQKMGIARCLFRKPEILVVSSGLAAFDRQTQLRLLKNILETFEHKTIVWVLERPDLCQAFDRVIVVEHGKVVEQGTYAHLTSVHSKLKSLLEAEQS